MRSRFAIAVLTGACLFAVGCRSDDHVVLPEDVRITGATTAQQRANEPRCSDVLASTTTTPTTTRPNVSTVTIVVASGCRP